jgi:hypothetical protein
VWEMRSRPCETALEVVASATDVGARKSGRTSDCTTTHASTLWESASIAGRDHTILLTRNAGTRMWYVLLVVVFRA